MNELQDKFRQHNDLINATKEMNNIELKLFFYACTIREEKEQTISVPFINIAKKLNIKKGGKQYGLMKKALENTVKASVVSIAIDEDTEIIRPILTADINKKTQIVTFEFEKKFLFLLDDLKKNYTWMYLEQLSKLNLSYSARIYEFCKMRLGKNNKKIIYTWYLKDLRDFLNLNDKYPKWYELKRWALDPAMREINEKCSDVSFVYKILKNRAVYAIEMTIYAFPYKILENAMNNNNDDVLPGQLEMEFPRSRRKTSKSLSVVERQRIENINKNIYNWLED